MEDVNRVDNSNTADADVDADADGVDNSGIGIERAKGSNGNSKIRHLKIVSFSINDITSYGYSMQLIMEMMKLIKSLLGLK